MAHSTAPAAARRSNPVGTPAPASWWRRRRNGKAAKHVTVREAWFLARREVLYYAKTFFITKLWPAAWRNKDRTCLALIPAVWLIAGFWWTLPACIIAGLGWDHYRPRCRNTRRVTAANRHMGRQVVYAPKVVAVQECHAPRRQLGARSEHFKLGPATLTAPGLAALLDRVKPLVHRPPLVSEYHTLAVPPGIHPDDYEKMKVTLGARLHTSLTFDRSHTDPSRVTMRIQRADWLARQVPWTRQDGLTPMRLPIGMDWDAHWQHDSIHDQAWLVAGQRGAGKTAFLRGICGRLWNMPSVELYLADHLGDLEDFDGHATRYTDTLDGALTLLEDFAGLHAKANIERRNNGLKYLSWPDHPCRVLIVDELGALTTHPDKDIRERVTHSLYLIATQGRKTAHSLLAATQHPSAAVLPTVIRSQFTRRLALRLGDPRESAMALGTNRYDCTTIPEADKGRGWWMRDSKAVQLRTPGLYDHNLSWLFDDGKPTGNHGRWWETDVIDVQESAGTVGNSRPLPPLHLVPALVERDLSDEDRLWRVLEQAPPGGLEVKDIVRLSGVGQSKVYRWLKPGRLPWVQTVQSVQPRKYRLVPGVRRSA